MERPHPKWHGAKARKGAYAASTKGRFVVVFDGTGVDADGKESMLEELLVKLTVLSAAPY